MHNVQIRIKRAPQGVPTPDDFEIVESEAPRVSSRRFLCRARWLSLDPFVCAGPGGTGPRPGDIVPAYGVCEVIESRHDVFNVGDYVVLPCGLQELCLSDGTGAHELHPGQYPSSTALGILGPPGMAAYFGLLEVAGLRPGETVLVSAASNAAGSMAGQIAMIRGARAIGIAGSREKRDWVIRHARFSACIDYRSESLGARLRQLAPGGVDIYFDNSAGEILETVLAGNHLAPGGRVVLNCSSPRRSIAGSSGEHVDSLTQTRTPILRVNALDYESRREEFLREAIPWLGDGLLVYKEDVVEGLPNAVAQLCKVMRGENFGRGLVKV